jgi:hypothetical protein
MTYGPVGLSYPKPRELITKIIPIARTDSSTAKCTLPKDAIIAGVYVIQTSNAVTGAGAYNLGWSGATTGILNAFSLPTTSVGYSPSGTATGAQVATKLTQDQQIIGTYTVGTSTAGGVGYIKLEYFVPGPGEAIDD